MCVRVSVRVSVRVCVCVCVFHLWLAQHAVTYAVGDSNTVPAWTIRISHASTWSSPPLSSS